MDCYRCISACCATNFRNDLRGLTIKYKGTQLLIASAVSALLLLTGPSSAQASVDLPDRIRKSLDAQDPGTPLQHFYSRRMHEPVWFGDRGLLSIAGTVPGLFASTINDGLRPEDYDYTALRRTIAAYQVGLRPLPPVELELALTGAVLAYASDMLRGRVRPEEVYSNWESAPRELDLARYLQEALDAGRLIPSLRSLAPRHAHYHRLRDLLWRYRLLELEGGPEAVPHGETLKIGLRSPRVAALRRRLLQIGDLTPAAAESASDLFDATLESAVKRYQTRHGLQPDGVAGTLTLGSLNVPLEERIRTIEFNMERWRWLPRDLGERFITVNIAGFQLYVVEHDEITMTMPVVVGKRYHSTPVFSGSMTYLVFSPYWNVPRSIAVNEMLPKLRENPAYLEQESMQVFRGWEQPIRPLDPAAIDWSSVEPKNFPYRFRQLPGAHNALGRVKFMFPNKYSVYLHDTPAKGLFSRAARDFSHGCIRVSRPMELAEYLLSDQPEWDAERIARAGERGVEQSVPLASSWPVHVLYWTSWVGPEGEVHFRDDVYGRDKQLAEALHP
ncbi:MAG TPA: L,D-transpeptidase family protein [Arenicellales bacterium]|nr:L,D-transpeptidase family protein [Arenicellales bacterium]